MDIAALLKSAFEQPVSPERPIGCGRVYVSITDDAFAKKVKAAAKKLGKDFQPKSYYGTKNALYIGYDNMDGRALARGTAVVAALNSAGIPCYRDEQGD
jgi:hypothetical protein